MAKVRVNVDAFARLIAAVAERPRSYRTIGEESGLHYHTVRAYINALHKHKQVHIAGWEKNARGISRVPLFLLGFGIDVPRPKLDAAARQRARRTRERQGRPPPKPRKSTRPVINSVFALGEKVK